MINFHSLLSSFDTHEITIAKFPFDQEIRKSKYFTYDWHSKSGSLCLFSRKYGKGSQNCTAAIYISSLHLLYLPRHPLGLSNKVLKKEVQGSSFKGSEGRSAKRMKNLTFRILDQAIKSRKKNQLATARSELFI